MVLRCEPQTDLEQRLCLFDAMLAQLLDQYDREGDRSASARLGFLLPAALFRLLGAGDYG
jgi:hypothetical protein